MASNEDPLSELEYIPDSIVDLTSPLNSVDDTTKDRMIVQEELERRLKQRAGRQDLVERNILPSLSLPTASKLFTNSQQLHRAKLADNLQKKMRNRPGRDNLLQMNILPDLQVNVDPALQAKQLQLKKIKLADVLNDKLAHRPGPLQLLQEGIIEPQLSQVVRGVDVEESSPPNVSPTASMVNTTNYPPTSEAGIGELPAISLPLNFSRQLGGRHSIAGSSPSAELIMDTSPSSVEGPRARPSFGLEGRKFSDSSISPAPSPRSMEDSKSPDKSPRGFNSSYPPHFKPVLSPGVMSATSKNTSSSASIRKKQQKKYRKLRYHEYIPPSKSTPKGGKTNPKPPSKSDSPYSSILAQQQLLLQLQVLHQQYPNGVLMQKIPEMINNLSKEQKSLAVAATKGKISAGNAADPALNKQLSQPQVVPVEVPNKYNTSSVRFEDLKVSDLKAACKELGMIISGKKAELVDRLMDHNKGLLPAMALPENLLKESRRQVFSLGQCSIDSQVSNSTLSPSSPTSSPVFQFPSDRGLGASDPGVGGSGKAATMAELHKEFNEMFERQKRNYICHKGMTMEKSIAPRPEFSELLNFKLSSTSGGPSPPPPPPLSSFASLQLDHHQQQQQQQPQRVKGNSLPRGQVLVNSVDARTHLSAADNLSRSMPSSPNPGSPHQDGNHNSEVMDSTSSGASNQEEKKMAALATSTLSSVSQAVVSSGASAMVNSSTSSTINGGGMVTFSNNVEQLGSTGMATGGLGPNAAFYQQQQQARLQAQPATAANRPGRASLPAPSGLHSSATPSMGLPSYNSVMRSRSIASMQPNLASVTGQMTLNNGLPYGSDLRGVSTPPNELANKPIHQDIYNPQDNMEMSMDTGEISDIFDDFIKADGEGFNHPASLPVMMGGSSHLANNPTRGAHSSLPQTPQYNSSPSKLTPAMHHDLSSSISPSSSMTHQASNPMLSTFLPSLSSQHKSGSDICLSLPEGRDGQKDSIDGAIPYNSGFTVGNELNWLNLDNTSGMNFSPTYGNAFGSLANSHSNPGSLPHDQFQHAFLDDSMGAQMGVMGMGQMVKNSNPALNGFGLPPHCATGGASDMPFLDAGIMSQSTMYPATEDEKLLELGLSR